jgi:hypothetical protein
MKKYKILFHHQRSITVEGAIGATREAMFQLLAGCTKLIIEEVKENEDFQNRITGKHKHFYDTDLGVPWDDR